MFKRQGGSQTCMEINNDGKVNLYVGTGMRCTTRLIATSKSQLGYQNISGIRLELMLKRNTTVRKALIPSNGGTLFAIYFGFEDDKYITKGQFLSRPAFFRYRKFPIFCCRLQIINRDAGQALSFTMPHVIFKRNCPF